MDNVKEKLDEAMDQVYEDLAHSSPGTEEYESARKAVETITKLEIDQWKAEAETSLKDEENRIAQKRNEEELEIKKKSEKRERWGLILGIGSTVGSLVMYGWGLKRITKFETEGVITSKTFGQLPKLTNLFGKK